MIKQHSFKKITRAGIPSFRLKSKFDLPESNRYFVKVLKNHNLISESMGNTSAFQKTETNEDQRSSTLNRSLSFSLSRKMSQKQSICEMRGSVSLPKIDQKKNPEADGRN